MRSARGEKSVPDHLTLPVMRLCPAIPSRRAIPISATAAHAQAVVALRRRLVAQHQRQTSMPVPTPTSADVVVPTPTRDFRSRRAQENLRLAPQFCDSATE